jgi:hypothetical protein
MLEFVTVRFELSVGSSYVSVIFAIGAVMDNTAYLKVLSLPLNIYVKCSMYRDKLFYVV